MTCILFSYTCKLGRNMKAILELEFSILVLATLPLFLFLCLFTPLISSHLDVTTPSWTVTACWTWRDLCSWVACPGPRPQARSRSRTLWAASVTSTSTTSCWTSTCLSSACRRKWAVPRKTPIASLPPVRWEVRVCGGALVSVSVSVPLSVCLSL